VIDRLWSEIAKIALMPDVRDKFEPAGYVMATIGPDAAAAKVRADRAKWTQLVREAGVKPE
jgi:tripartite-type tricarboxylate transporter receptor subunit TctC